MRGDFSLQIIDGEWYKPPWRHEGWILSRLGETYSMIYASEWCHVNDRHLLWKQCSLDTLPNCNPGTYDLTTTCLMINLRCNSPRHLPFLQSLSFELRVQKARSLHFLQNTQSWSTDSRSYWMYRIAPNVGRTKSLCWHIQLMTTEWRKL
jgi:hypothetical protein